VEVRPVLVDTNAYVAFKRGDHSLVEVFQQAEILGMSPIVLGELLAGFECGNKVRKNRDELHEFLSVSRIKLFPVTSDTAPFYSQIYSLLKRKGKPIPSNDMWIAAQALEKGSVLCTFDKHFNAIEGLITGTTLTDLFI
jgi:tRNA(fMet)-specific endonuclease VapC